MPGSRKGEHRGAANPNRVRRAPSVKKPRTSKPRRRNIVGMLDEGTALVVNSKARFVADQERELYMLATGEVQRLPKDVMVSTMQYFERVALDWMSVMHANMQAEVAATNLAEKVAYRAAVAAAEGQVRDYLVLACDVGSKVAQYIHPKFSAIAIAGAGDTPLNAMAQLMRDLAELGSTRAQRFIEHDPDEKPRPSMVQAEPAE